MPWSDAANWSGGAGEVHCDGEVSTVSRGCMRMPVFGLYSPSDSKNDGADDSINAGILRRSFPSCVELPEPLVLAGRARER